MTLGDYIRAYRKETKVSQREFAKKCGLSNGYISMLERGINPKTKEPITPSLILLKKLADGMCVTVNDILLEVDDMPVDVGVSVKDQPTVSDGLSDVKRDLIRFAENLTNEQAALALRVLKSIVGDGQ